MKRGFTLIELSIVLVIIGLIVGGILVGQTMIQTAQNRKMVSQLEEWNTAANAFKIKYGCVAGDCRYAKLDQFGFYNPQNSSGYNSANDPYMSNEDGLVCSNFGWGNMRSTQIESNVFFLHLQQASMLKEPLDPSLVARMQSGAANNTSATGDTAWPKLIGTGLGVFPVAFNGQNYLRSGFYANSHAPYAGTAYQQFAFSPAQAFYIDSKTDDGIATTGSVIATGNIYTNIDPWMFVPTISNGGWEALPAEYVDGNSIAGTNGANNLICYDSTSLAYNIAADKKICNLAMRAKF